MGTNSVFGIGLCALAASVVAAALILKPEVPARYEISTPANGFLARMDVATGAMIVCLAVKPDSGSQCHSVDVDRIDTPAGFKDVTP